MSEYVRVKGIIKEINTNDIEKWCEKKLKEEYKVIELPSYYDNFSEFLIDKCDDKFLIANGKLYEFIRKEKLSYEDEYYNSNKINEVEIEFDTLYYDGVSSLKDAIEECLLNLK